MCPRRGSFMCLVRNFTASAMSALSWATDTNVITKIRYEVDPADVSFSEFSICAVCSSFLITRREPVAWSPEVLQQASRSPSKSSSNFARQSWSFHSGSSTPSHLRQSPACFTSKPFPKHSQDLQLPPSCHQAEFVVMARSYEISLLTTKNTLFRPSWNHPATLLTTCLSRLTLHLAFRRCPDKIEPVILFCSFPSVLFVPSRRYV